MSMPPRAPRWPASVTRTSYQVGRPWMFEGKMLRGLTGTPWRRIERANISLALAEPEPLTLAKRTTKSFTLLIGFLSDILNLLESYRSNISACPRLQWDNARRTARNAGRHPRP